MSDLSSIQLGGGCMKDLIGDQGTSVVVKYQILMLWLFVIVLVLSAICGWRRACRNPRVKNENIAIKALESSAEGFRMLCK